MLPRARRRWRFRGRARTRPRAQHSSKSGGNTACRAREMHIAYPLPARRKFEQDRSILLRRRRWGRGVFRGRCGKSGSSSIPRRVGVGIPRFSNQTQAGEIGIRHDIPREQRVAEVDGAVTVAREDRGQVETGAVHAHVPCPVAQAVENRAAHCTIRTIEGVARSGKVVVPARLGPGHQVNTCCCRSPETSALDPRRRLRRERVVLPVPERRSRSRDGRDRTGWEFRRMS